MIPLVFGSKAKYVYYELEANKEKMGCENKEHPNEVRKLLDMILNGGNRLVNGYEKSRSL